MMLINSLLAHASDTRWEGFIDEIERLNVRKAVIVCASPSQGTKPDLTDEINERSD